MHSKSIFFIIPHPFYWKTKSAFAVRDGDWKLIVNRDTHQNELYDLAKDFRETRNLSDIHPEKVKEMTPLLEEFKKGDR